jgi:hypothetical protein
VADSPRFTIWTWPLEARESYFFSALETPLDAQIRESLASLALSGDVAINYGYPSFFYSYDQTLYLSAVKVGDGFLRVEFDLHSAEPLQFILTSAESILNPNVDEFPVYDNGLLSILDINLGGNRFSVELSIVANETDMIFELAGFEAL